MASQRRKIRFIEPLNASERRKTRIVEHQYAPKCRNIRLDKLPNVSGRHSTRILVLPCVSRMGCNKHQRQAPPTMPAPSSVPAQLVDICRIQGLKSSDPHTLQSPSLHVSNSPRPNPRMPKPSHLQGFKSPSFQIIKGGAGGRGVTIQ